MFQNNNVLKNLIATTTSVLFFNGFVSLDVNAQSYHPSIETSVPEKLILANVCPDESKVTITYRFPLQTAAYLKKASTAVKKTTLDGNIIQFSMLGHSDPRLLTEIACTVITSSKDIQKEVREKTSIVIEVESEKAKESMPKFECLIEDDVYITVTYLHDADLTHIARSVRNDKSGISIHLPGIIPLEESYDIGCDEGEMLKFFPSLEKWAVTLKPPRRLPSVRDMMHLSQQEDGMQQDEEAFIEQDTQENSASSVDTLEKKDTEPTSFAT